MASVIEPITPMESADKPVVAVKRRTIDFVLSSLGLAMAAILLTAGLLLTWGSNFAGDYVHDELSSQQVFFPDEETLAADNPALVKFAGQQVVNGDQAEGYAKYIAGHLEATADGLTYAELGTPERAARADVQAAKDAGASEEEIAALQTKADTITNQRNTLFKGETLRGLLLSSYAWDTVGKIAGFAAIGAFAGAALMFVLSLLGFFHWFKVQKA